jgi:hypothetical protein
MCDASALATASLGGQFAGAATSAVGGYYGAQAQKSGLGFSATLDNLNASAAERTAQAALLAGQHTEQAIDLNTAALKGKQITGMAANGIDLGSAGAARVLTSTDVMGAADAATANANAVRAAWGYRTQATNFQNAALMKRAGANSISPLMSGASSLLGSAGSVASSWYQLKKAGAFQPQPSAQLPATDSWNFG